MFRLALSAGHYKYTAGKRTLRSLDRNETREWVLNDRICNKIEQRLSQYSDCQVLRLDDTNGEKPIGLIERTNAANRFKADFYLAVHHNAGAKGTSAGGITSVVYPGVGKETLDWQKQLYEALIKYTGLRGNRSNPLPQSDLHEVRESNMPAVLLELGFMDSTIDTPIILTEEYAEKCADAIVEVIVRKAGLESKNPKPPQEIPEADKNVLYIVQAGIFRDKSNAEALALRLRNSGFDAIITEERS